MDKFVSYAQSGVDIDANEQMIEKIWSSVAGTYGPRVVESKGGFAGMFRLDYDEKLFKKNYKNPVLVAGTDGVGSKVQLAPLIKRYDTVGIDLVAMSIDRFCTDNQLCGDCAGGMPLGDEQKHLQLAVSQRVHG